MHSPLALERKCTQDISLLSESTLLITSYSAFSDPLVSHGRHFGRTIHALCNVKALLTNGLLRMGEWAGRPEETLTLA
jgi:hypothetical protein